MLIYAIAVFFSTKKDNEIHIKKNKYPALIEKVALE
jgi:hypothetical protein